MNNDLEYAFVELTEGHIEDVAQDAKRVLAHKTRLLNAAMLLNRNALLTSKEARGIIGDIMR